MKRWFDHCSITSCRLQLLCNWSHAMFIWQWHTRITRTAIFNTWHAFRAEWLTFVSIETGVRFQCALCNRICWSRPFLDNGAEQRRPPQGVNPSLAAGWRIFLSSFHTATLFIYCRSPKPLGSVFGSRSPLSFTSHCQTSPPLPALFIQTSSHNLHLLNLSLPRRRRRRSPASFLSSRPLLCTLQQSWCISKHFL